MKKLSSISMVCVLVIISLCSANPGQADGSDYLGELCWSLHNTQNEHGSTDDTHVIKIAVTYTGGTNFIVQGIIELVDDNPFIFGGTARLVGNEFLMTMNGSQDHSPDPWRDTGTLHMRLDTKTWNGTFWQNRLDYNTSTREFDYGYASGTATIATCP